MAAVNNKLDEKLLDNFENEDELAKETDAAEKFQNFERKRVIEKEQIFNRIKAEENSTRIPAFEELIPLVTERGSKSKITLIINRKI